MRVRVSSLLPLAAALLFSIASSARAQGMTGPRPEAYGKLPLSFEANHGQTDPQVRFLSRGSGYSLFLTDSAAVLSLHKGGAQRVQSPLHKAELGPLGKTDVIRMELAHASHSLHVEGADKLPGTANYFLGNDPAKWRSAVPTFAKVRYDGVYPGVDLLYYGNQSQLEYDFVVAPHADPRPIRLRFAGARKLRLDPNGDLEVIAQNGQIAFHKPIVYQEIGGRRQSVEGAFALLAGNTVAFTLGTYDHEKAVVIDPVLAYSTYLGGSSSLNGSTGYNIAVDSSGSAYIVGVTNSVDFPTTSGAYQTVNHTGTSAAGTYGLDMFVTKLNPAGNALVYSTFLGGSGNVVGSTAVGDTPTSVTVDSSGNAYIAGAAYSTDFPTTPGAIQNTNKAYARAQQNGFVTKLNPTGTALVYSTYLGGSGSASSTANGDGCGQVKLDTSGNTYVVGVTQSADFPTTTGAYQTSLVGSTGGFVAKLNFNASALVYSTLLVGTEAFALAVDSAGDAYVAGEAVAGFTTTSGAYQPTVHATNSSNGFVAKVNPAGSSLLYATFLGGSGDVINGATYGDGIYNLALNAAGEVYLNGFTYSNDFPTTSGALQTINKARNPASSAYAVLNPSNYFVSRLNASGSGLIFSTYLGSSGGESGSDLASMALDGGGNVYITGTSYGLDYPTTANAFQPHNNSAGHSIIVTPATAAQPNPPVYAATGNAILTEISATGALVYSTYFGGSGYPEFIYYPGLGLYGNYFPDQGVGLALDSSGNIYLTGEAESPDFPITSGAYRTGKAAQSQAFVTKFNMGATASSSGTITTLTSDGNPQNAGSTSTFTAQVESLSGGTVPTGNVTFSVDGASDSPVTLSSAGRATYGPALFAPGTHTVVASYSGNSTYTASASPALTQTIVLLPASITLVSGGGQSGATGTAFAKPIVVQVANANGVPVPNASVSFAGTGLTFSSAAVLTNSSGQASVTATPVLGGLLRATAGIAGTTPLLVLFTESGVATASTTAPSFGSMAVIATGASASGASLQATSADLNGDGLQDLAATNTIDASVSVLLGKGNGTFQPAVNYATGNGPYGVVAGDANNDGKMDLAVVNGLDNTVSLLLNSATGFPAAPSSIFAVGNQPYGASVADFNRDGLLDIAVTNNAGNSVSVVLNGGQESLYASGNTPFGTAVADFNNDGYPDLAVENYADNTVGVLLNTGSGSFYPQTTTATGTGPFSVTTGDFNGDGYADVAVANLGSNTVSVLLNNKAGGFAAKVNYATGNLPTSVLAVDLNGDGILDLAVTNLSDGTVSILLGKGDGTFLAQTTVAAGTEPYSVIASDFNGDGRPDLAVTNFYSPTIGVLLQLPAGSSGKIKASPPRTLKTVPIQ